MDTPIVDCHTHTSFSDGTSTFEENVRAAAAAGCRVLVSTDHLTLPASLDESCEAQVSLARLVEHRAAFEAARGLASEIVPELELIYGFECDWYPGCEEYVRTWSEGAIVRLGSVHYIGNPGDIATGAAGQPGTEGTPQANQIYPDSGWIDYNEDKHVWENLGADEVWRRYVDTWCKACESSLEFDTMAHPDLAARFANEGFAPTIDLSRLWDQMVECAHDTGRRIEVSTAGLRKTTANYYPSAGLLHRFAKAGVTITTGSDAHRAVDVCCGIQEAYRYAYAAGYRSIEVPHADGSWESVEIQ